jgi:hypothetical protein
VNFYGDSSDCADARHCTAPRHVRLHSNEVYVKLSVQNFWALHSGSNRAKAGQNSNSSTPLKRLKTDMMGKESSQDKENVSFNGWFDLFPASWNVCRTRIPVVILLIIFRSHFNLLSELFMIQRDRGK